MTTPHITHSENPKESSTASSVRVMKSTLSRPDPAFNRWRQKCKQRAHRKLKALHLDEYERLELEAQLELWDERPPPEVRQVGVQSEVMDDA